VFCDESYSASPRNSALFVMTCNCNSQQCFVRKATVFFPTWLRFITKLNSNQFNILKKIDEDNFEKKITKKNTKETGKKPCEEKLY